MPVNDRMRMEQVWAKTASDQTQIGQFDQPRGEPWSRDCLWGVLHRAAEIRLSPPTVFSYWLGAAWDGAEQELGTAEGCSGECWVLW